MASSLLMEMMQGLGFTLKSITTLTRVCLLHPEPVPHISKMPGIIIPDLNVCDKEGGYLAASSLI